MSDPILRVESLDVAAGNRTLVAGLSVKIHAGDCIAILGCNGAGKSLTLQTLAGLRKPASGRVFLDDNVLDSLKRRTIARRLALLPQEVTDSFPELALERALLGRHPHRTSWGRESTQDTAIAIDALRAMQIGELAMRSTTSLSGGERQRLALAQVLTQQPTLYLLDEPTNHLDIRHQYLVLEHFRTLARTGSSVVMSLHDINLAARFADKCLLLFGDGDTVFGASDAVMSEENLSRLLGVPLNKVPLAECGCVFVVNPADEPKI